VHPIGVLYRSYLTRRLKCDTRKKSNICDSLTILKGFIQLDRSNNRLDHSIIILQQVENLEILINELVKET